MNNPSTDVIRRVFDGDGGFLEIGPWPDAPESCLELRTLPGKEGVDYYGPLNIPLSAPMAAELGRALIAAAAEMERPQ